MKLSIIIVNYNTKALLKQTLQSVYNHPPQADFEVFVVDNHSTDSSVEMVKQNFPQVKLIENQENEGFSRANNRAIRISKGEYILLLNSDTVVLPNTFDIMLDFMDKHPQVGAAGCKVLLPDGKLDLACRRSFPTPLNALFQALGLSKLFPKSRLFAQYNLTYLDEDQTYPVDCLVGAFMLVRRKTIEQVGLLDETFFMYGEDIDWCYRIKKAGWEIYYYPEARIIHYKGASSKKKKYRMIYEFHRAMVIFYQKHYAPNTFVLVNIIVLLGIWLRYLVALVRNLFK
ncbi:glycosyltransferase family 2 protein [Carboxydocella sp. ULO1]|uniref:glycosyltransferase family 2 protein n=1 Tax=Carboxydocella sp. ULO1 TaxID=1926599 RepID=UPI0009ABC065|nr:glycosyltransferase family 2 protein [Carboxydocella sp. ULO1]GAW29473.1 glycosyl transferase family 2 [Carboxydocella sp. ULO1]